MREEEEVEGTKKPTSWYTTSCTLSVDEGNVERRAKVVKGK